MLFSCLRAAALGPVAVIWSYHKDEPKIIRILLSGPKKSAGQKMAGLFADAKPSSHKKISILADKIAKSLRGQDIRFSLSAVRLDLCPAFQKRVLLAQYAINLVTHSWVRT